MSEQPNFLVIGAARSGTTLLHQYFLQHPDIYVPKNKQPEPHYFLKSSNYEKGVENYLDSFFTEVGKEKAIGEISTSNMYGEHVAKRIFEFDPNMKLIVLLREPVQRAFSNYWHSKNNGFEKLTFQEAILTEDSRLAGLDREIAEIAPYAYIGRSRFATQLERFLKYFKKEQIHISLFEDLISKTRAELVNICGFLNVDNSFAFELIKEKLNKSVPEGGEMDKRVMLLLKAKFKPENERLAKLFDLNLKPWK